MRLLYYSLLPLLTIGCSDKKNGNDMPDMAMPTLGPAPALAIACTDTLDDVYKLPAGLPAMDDTHRGDVFRCAPSESMTATQVNAKLKEYKYGGASVNSGFWSWRVAYRTERIKPASGNAPEGDTPAILLVPEHPIPGAPLVVYAHASGGIAPKCAPSLMDIATTPAVD
jgi:hypothetical protein